MTQDWTSRALWAAAGLALIAGIVLTASTVRSIEGRAERRNAKRGYLRDVRQMARALGPYRAAFERRATDTPTAPPSIDDLQASIDGLPEADDVRRSAQSLTDGWQAIRKTFVFNRAPLDRVMAFVEAAENGKVPWNLIRCDIRALSRDEAGVAAITVEFETLRGPSR